MKCYDAGTQKKLEALKVLIIDDQPEVRALVRDVLAEAGVNNTYEAKDGDQGWKYINQGFQPVDLIVCDWTMPNMNGIDFLKKVRSIFPYMPFLMVTGKADKDSVLEAKNAGVSAFIRKPFSQEQLESKLRALISNDALKS